MQCAKLEHYKFLHFFLEISTEGGNEEGVEVYVYLVHFIDTHPAIFKTVIK